MTYVCLVGSTFPCLRFQCEDWQGEKSDTSLLESVNPLDIIALLEDAELWLMNIEGDLLRKQTRSLLIRSWINQLVRDLPFREGLLNRIQLRKVGKSYLIT